MRALHPPPGAIGAGAEHHRQVRDRLVAFVMVWCLTLGMAVAAGSPRVLIFHLDAVSASDFDRALASGLLPHVAEAFAGGTSSMAVTLFPACTSIIYPSMRTAVERHETPWIGIGGFDRDRQRPVTNVEVFLGLAQRVPRRAVTAFAHGLPGLDGLVGSAMQNVPDLLDRYGVVEVLWFATDAIGHVMGASAHHASLVRFDEYLGRLWPRLDLHGLDVILYSDHGMSFSDVTFDVETWVYDRLGDAVVHQAYPNLYLRDPAGAPAAAAEIARAGGVDYAFHRVDADRVAGYVDGAAVAFVREGDAIRYESRDDPLGYRDLGYDGAALTEADWLALTIDSWYPAVPPNVFGYLQHPDVGDVVAGVNAPRIPLTAFTNRGNHAGLMRDDMVVRVLARGPSASSLASVTWLHEVLRGFPVQAAGVMPTRERHEVALRLDLDDRTPTVRFRFSPEYRLRLATEVGVRAWGAWTEHDVFATYLTRWWIGVGVADGGGGLAPLLRGEVQLDLGDGTVTLEASFGPGGLTVRVGATARLVPGVRVTWGAPRSVGIAFEW